MSLPHPEEWYICFSFHIIQSLTPMSRRSLLHLSWYGRPQSHFMCLEIWQFEEARANLKIIFKRSFIITYYRKKYASHWWRHFLMFQELLGKRQAKGRLKKQTEQVGNVWKSPVSLQQTTQYTALGWWRHSSVLLDLLMLDISRNYLEQERCPILKLRLMSVSLNDHTELFGSSQQVLNKLRSV